MAKKKTYATAAKRKAVLSERKKIKMARSAHAYVRGNTAKFYEWLTSAEGLKLPQGPAVWICGDCHIGNLGPLANAKNYVDIQIRDLDQTVIGNPAHDLIRLGLSLASAARGSDLAGVVTAQMVEQMMEGYEHAFIAETDGKKEALKKPEVVALSLESALTRTPKQLVKERLENTKPTIPLGKKFWPLTSQEHRAIKQLFNQEEIHHLVTSLRSRDNEAPIELLDAAYWVKGCSSLGQLRYAVLLRVGGKGGELCLMDVKEATPALAPTYPKIRMPKDHAMRVVTGAKHLSPALGNRMIAAEFLQHSVFIRELLPQDLKFEIEHLSAPEAIKAARFLAFVVGKAHARQMDESDRQHWQNELARNRTQTLDAPSWLWKSIVELMVSHEMAYLDHCRKYANNTPLA